MLTSWDNAKVRAAASSPQAKEKALKDGTLKKEDKDQLQWVEDIIPKSKKQVELFNNKKLDPKNNKPPSFAPFLSYCSKNELFQIEARVILGANPIAHLRKHPSGWLYYRHFPTLQFFHQKSLFEHIAPHIHTEKNLFTVNLQLI